MDMQTLTIKANRVGPISGRHPWVFSGALQEIPEGIEPGTPVRLADPRGRYLASGYFNSYSQIAVRIWGHDEREQVDRPFFLRRILWALELRRMCVGGDTNAYRVINGEGDLLPGLVVDRYDRWLSVQFHNRGIERWKDTIVKALIEALEPEGIYERSEATSRRREGAAPSTGLLWGKVPDIAQVRESGLNFHVDIAGGQKTGFFLDQRDKRLAIMKYAKGKKILNCFSYSGGFTMYALMGMAQHVTSVDTSARALELARKNILINGFDEVKAEFIDADVKKYITSVKHGEYDLIILDPPAFIKDRRKKAEGLRGYKAINEAAMRALPVGGLLLTCSCSAHLSPLDFRHMVSESGGSAGRTLQIMESFTHGTDHPVLVPYTEGEYLKCVLIRVLE